MIDSIDKCLFTAKSLNHQDITKDDAQTLYEAISFFTDNYEKFTIKQLNQLFENTYFRNPVKGYFGAKVFNHYLNHHETMPWVLSEIDSFSHDIKKKYIVMMAQKGDIKQLRELDIQISDINIIEYLTKNKHPLSLETTESLLDINNFWALQTPNMTEEEKVSWLIKNKADILDIIPPHYNFVIHPCSKKVEKKVFELILEKISTDDNSIESIKNNFYQYIKNFSLDFLEECQRKNPQLLNELFESRLSVYPQVGNNHYKLECNQLQDYFLSVCGKSPQIFSRLIEKYADILMLPVQKNIEGICIEYDIFNYALESANTVFFENIRTSVGSLSLKHQEIVIAYCFYHIKNITKQEEDLGWFEPLMVNCPEAFNKIWHYQKEHGTSSLNEIKSKKIETLAFKNHLMQNLPIKATNAKIKLKV